jgi:hypothetical protein
MQPSIYLTVMNGKLKCLLRIYRDIANRTSLPEAIIDLFNQRCVSFKGIEQVNEVLKLVMNLANNTRIWENNGHTPNEIFEKFEKPKLKPLPAE